MNRKGELTSTQIVGIVMLIAGFIVLLLFLPTIFDIFGDGGDVDRELCFQSVLARATARELPVAGGSAADAVPLRCTTEKICISGSGRADACEQFAGEENIRVVEIDFDNEREILEAVRVIERESANAMFFCWQMMGEGKLDIFGKGSTFDNPEPKCVICSRVAIGQDVPDSVKSRVDVAGYMEKERVPGSSLTYVEFLSDQRTKSFPDVENFEPGLLTDQYAFIFGQIKSRETSDALQEVAGGSILIAGAARATPIVGAVAKNPYVIASAAIVGIGAGGVAAYEAYQGQQIAAGYCGDFTSTAESKKGCSIVTGIKWDASQINGFCTGGIEGEL